MIDNLSSVNDFCRILEFDWPCVYPHSIYPLLMNVYSGKLIPCQQTIYAQRMQSCWRDLTATLWSLTRQDKPLSSYWTSTKARRSTKQGAFKTIADSVVNVAFSNSFTSEVIRKFLGHFSFFTCFCTKFAAIQTLKHGLAMVSPPPHPTPPTPLIKIELLELCKICERCLTSTTQHCPEGRGISLNCISYTWKCFKRFYRDCTLIVTLIVLSTVFVVNVTELRYRFVSFLDDAFRKNLESALRFGNPLLVQVSS